MNSIRHYLNSIFDHQTDFYSKEKYPAWKLPEPGIVVNGFTENRKWTMVRYNYFHEHWEDLKGQATAIHEWKDL